MPTGFDLETFLIGPRSQAPQPVCGSFYAGVESAITHHNDQLENMVWGMLDRGDIIVCHNAAFDMSVIACNYPDLMPRVFRAYEEGRIFCTMVNEKLHVLKKTGNVKIQKYSLAALTQKYFSIDISEDKKITIDGVKYDVNQIIDIVENPETPPIILKQIPWRYKYCTLFDTPISEWPEEAIRYAKDDAEICISIMDAQQEMYGPPLEDMKRQVYTDFCLRLMTICGIEIDREAALKLNSKVTQHIEEAMKVLVKANIYQPKTKKPGADLVKKTKAVQELVQKAYIARNQQVPLTDTGRISCDKAALEEVAGDDPILDVLREVSEDKGLKEKFLPTLLVPDSIVHPSYDVLKNSGRTSSFKPNIQQLPRKEGVRQCFKARDGFLFLAIDYSTLELCTLAQVIYDKCPGAPTNMMDAINAGKDLHLLMASHITYRPYEELVEHKKDKDVKQARQMAKAANFGYPGGLGTTTFIDYAKGDPYNVIITQTEAANLRQAYFNTFPEMKDFFNFINNLPTVPEGYVVDQLRTDRVRGGADYCPACNSYFQGLAADGAKQAIREVTHEMYTDRESIVHGCAAVAFIHDEILFEIPEEGGPEQWSCISGRLSDIMVSAMDKWVPDVKITAEPALMGKCWEKNAEYQTDSDGYIKIWEAE